MARILDVGCGFGNPPARVQTSPEDDIVGVDIDEQRLAVARQRFPHRTFQCARAESLPFPDTSFDRVVSSVALPYMDIPKALAEFRRVLTREGSVLFSVHSFTFTLSELRKCVPRPIPTLFRLFVLLNGLYFHLTGKVLVVAGRAESFQTQRGLKLALERAGFANTSFLRPKGRLIVEAGCPAAVPVDQSATATQRPLVAQLAS